MPQLPHHPRRTALLVTACLAPLALAGCSDGGTARTADAPGTVTAAAGSCTWSGPAPSPGTQQFSVRSPAGRPGDALRVTLTDATTGGIWAQVTTLAPGTTRTVRTVLPAGSYQWRCTPLDGAAAVSATRATTGTGDGARPGEPLYAISADEVTDAVAVYRAAVQDRLGTLAADTDALTAAVDAGDLPGARSRWLTAHLDYERLGAAYGTFGDLADAVDGLPDGLPGGVADPGFTGFLRVERDLWSDAGTTGAAADAAALHDAVHALVDGFAGSTTDPADIPLRTHEILEMTAQRELTGRSDQGSGTGLATARANVDGTAMVLDSISSALTARDPQLLSDARAGLADLAGTLDGLRRPDGSWPAPEQLGTAQRQVLDARLGAVLERLAEVPDVLPMPPSTTPS